MSVGLWLTSLHIAINPLNDCDIIFELTQERSHWLILNHIIIHQTHYEKSDWSGAFNQFTIACELHMINAMSAA